MSFQSENNDAVHLDNKSPPTEAEIVYDLQRSDEKSDLQQIQQEQINEQQMELQEKQRLERIKKSQIYIDEYNRLPITIKRDLPTINEVSDNSISMSPAIPDTYPKVKKRSINQIEEEEKGQDIHDGIILKAPSLKRKKKKKFQTLDLDYEVSFNFKKYYKDNRIDLSWKLLFSYNVILITFNIILNLIEIIRYENSVCQLSGINNAFIYVNQIVYVGCKIGVLSLNYQEFTNTYPLKQKLPLLHTSLFSSIFPVLSMPLYVFDFHECEARSSIFTLEESLNILGFIDWCIISVAILTIILYSCVKISLEKTKWKTIKKISTVFYYLFLLLIHLLQILMLISQPISSPLPAMVLENFYFIFSVLSCISLTIYKYIFHQKPFEFINKGEKSILQK